jgi:hypothetical protein
MKPFAMGLDYLQTESKAYYGILYCVIKRLEGIILKHYETQSWQYVKPLVAYLKNALDER